MPWLVVILGFALFLLVGIYVVSGQWWAARPARDAKAIESWRKTQQLGFCWFVVRDSIPYGFISVFGQEWLRAWRRGDSLAMTREEIVSNVIWALAVGFFFGAIGWFFRRAAAVEACERATRITQNENKL